MPDQDQKDLEVEDPGQNRGQKRGQDRGQKYMEVEDPDARGERGLRGRSQSNFIMEPFGGTKALTEMLPGIVNFPILMRIILPGLTFVAWMWPFLPQGFRAVPSWTSILGLLGLTFALGTLVSILDRQIYQAYEGYIFWPGKVFSFRTRRLQGKVRAKLDEANKLRSRTDSYSSIRHDKLWYWLRMFPLDEEGEPVAKFPTLLGNILASYEEYPRSRYGMDAVFYWTRLWLVVEEKKKHSIDRDWSVADGLLYTSFATTIGTIVYAGRIVLDFSVNFAISLLILVVVSTFAYQVSLSFHRQNGEIFKSLFDLYRTKLIDLTSVSPQEIRKWRTAWTYLQYLQVACGCGKYYAATKEKCPHCEATTEENLVSTGTKGARGRANG